MVGEKKKESVNEDRTATCGTRVGPFFSFSLDLLFRCKSDTEQFLGKKLVLKKKVKSSLLTTDNSMVTSNRSNHRRKFREFFIGLLSPFSYLQFFASK